jgi:hypothetical protein
MFFYKKNLMLQIKFKNYLINNFFEIIFLKTFLFCKKNFKVPKKSCHFKTETTETVALCFGYPKTPCLRAEGKLSSSVDEQHIIHMCPYNTITAGSWPAEICKM